MAAESSVLKKARRDINTTISIKFSIIIIDTERIICGDHNKLSTTIKNKVKTTVSLLFILGIYLFTYLFTNNRIIKILTQLKQQIRLKKIKN